MTFVKYLVVVVVLVLNVAALGAGPAENSPAAVKIVSGDCTDESGQRVGSGLLFKRDQKIYLVTSSLNVSLLERACHKISSSPGKSEAATLLSYDWGAGLALLLLGTPKAAVNYATMSDFTPVSDTSITSVVGYSLLSLSPQVSNEGSVVTTQSHRHRFLQATEAIEYVGFTADRGLVGSPVLDKNQKVIGLISDQYLHLKSGSVTPIMRWKNSAQGKEGHLLVIPAPFVSEWLNTYFKAPQSRPTFNVAAKDVELGRRRVTVGPLTFEEKCPVSASGGSGDGGVGGNGVGTGGNGVGTGGTDTGPTGGDLPSGSWCVISVLGAEQPQPWPFANSQAWAQSLLTHLKAGRAVDVDYMVTRKKISSLLLTKRFRSIEDFFINLKNPAVTPVESVSGDYRTYTRDAKLLAVRNDAAYLSMLVTKVCSFLCWGPLDDLNKNVDVLVKVLLSENHNFVKPADIDIFIDQKGDYASAWSALNWERVEGAQRWKVYGEYGPTILKTLQALRLDLTK